jgi:hypothetical protein
MLWSSFPGLRLISFLDESLQTDGEVKPLLETLTRVHKVSDDLTFLALPRSLRIKANLDLALSIVTQQLLRNLAWRLPGFAESKLCYLAANFLEFTASLEEESAYRVVRLGRPPLNLVLSLTGMVRGGYQLSWLADRPFVLTQGQD